VSLTFGLILMKESIVNNNTIVERSSDQKNHLRPQHLDGKRIRRRFMIDYVCMLYCCHAVAVVTCSSRTFT